MIPRPTSIEDDPEIAESLGHVHSPRFVDPIFLADLRKIDPYLEARWNPNKSRWEIYRNNLYVMVVQTVPGDYAPLDNRVFQRLILIDTFKYRDSLDYIRNLHIEDEHLNRMKIREQDEYLRSVGRDARPFLLRRKSITASQDKVRAQECSS